jgi:predicted phage terminase large subunit-like protein
MMQRKKEGEYKFNALFQQRPSSPEGNIVSRDWWQYYDEKALDLSTMELIIQSWDMNFKDTKSGSFVVGQVWGLRGADVFLLHQVRGRWDFPATLEQFRLVDRQCQTSAKLVEDKANGPAVIASLKHEIPGILPVQVEASKVLRANAVSYLIKAGNVYLPKNAPWVEEFVDEWANFPNGANDDQVDGTTQALKFLLIPEEEQKESDVVVMEEPEESAVISTI